MTAKADTQRSPYRSAAWHDTSAGYSITSPRNNPRSINS